MERDSIQEITLPAEKQFFRVSEIPRLIANALHPECQNDDLVISGLYKRRKWSAPFSKEDVIAAERGDPIARTKLTSACPPSPEPLTEDECRAMSAIWEKSGLKPLAVPISNTAFAPYRRVLKQYLQAVDWDLEVVAEMGAAIRLVQAEIVQAKLLSEAIERKELRVFAEHTHDSISHYDEAARVPVSDVVRYLQGQALSVRIATVPSAQLPTHVVNGGEPPDESAKRDDGTWDVELLKKEHDAREKSGSRSPTKDLADKYLVSESRIRGVLRKASTGNGVKPETPQAFELEARFFNKCTKK